MKNTEDKIIPKEVDVAVIGSGMGGLISALELSKYGLKVGVFERRPIPGGYAHSFKRKDYTFDVSLHHIGGLEKGGMTHSILEPLNIFDKLDIIKREILFVSHFPDQIYTLPNNPDDIIEYLGQHFPKEKNGLRVIFQYLRNIKHHVVGPILFKDFDVPVDKLMSFKYKDVSYKSFLNRYIYDSRLISILGQMWMYLGLPPSLANTNYSTCIFSSGFIESSFYVKGGGTALTNAIVESLEEFGGKCYCKNGVQKIVLEDKIIKGVKLDDGTFVGAKVVISNASPDSTFMDLLSLDDISEIYRYRIQQAQVSTSCYSMYIGLDCLPSSLGMPKTNYFYNNSVNYEDAYEACMNDDILNTDWCLTSHEADALTNSPEGCGALSIAELTPPAKWFTLDEDQYKKEKEEVKNTLLKKYDKVFPGLIDHANIVEFGTPRTMHRYSGNPLGAIYGFANKVNDSTNKGLGNKTPINNLFLAGAWAQDGGGMEGAMMSGLQAANYAIESFGIERHDDRKNTFDDPAKRKDIKLDTGEYPMFSYHAKVYPDDVSYTKKTKITAFLRYMDRARVNLVNQSNDIMQIRSLFKDYYVNVYKLATCIHALAEVDDELIIKTGFRKTTSHRAAVDQLIFKADGVLLAEAITEIMFVRKDGGLVELPEVYKEYETLPIVLSKPKLPRLMFSEVDHFKYESNFTIFYEDTDAQGIVYNVSYPKLIDNAFWNIRKEFLKENNIVKNFHTSRAEIRFIKAAVLKDDLTIKAGYRPINDEIFAMDYRIFIKGTKTIIADAYFEYGYDIEVAH